MSKSLKVGFNALTKIFTSIVTRKPTDRPYRTFDRILVNKDGVPVARFKNSDLQRLCTLSDTSDLTEEQVRKRVEELSVQEKEVQETQQGYGKILHYKANNFPS